MTFIGKASRQAAFNVFQSLRRTRFHDQLREVTRINEHGDPDGQFQVRALESLFSIAATSEHYGRLPHRKSLEDFPVLEKSEIKTNPESFRTQLGGDQPLITVSTSGSYGVPMSLQLTQRKKVRQQAEVVYYGRMANYDVGVPHLYIRAHNSKGKLKLIAQNEWFSNTDSPDQDWLDRQVNLLKSKKLQTIIGFPSMAALIAQRARELGYEKSDFSVTGIITSGETLRPEQRAIIEQTFGAPCLSRYAAEEVGAIAGECAEGKAFHLNEASYIVEVLDLKSDQPVSSGDLGRIVVTDLHSHAMPLIRYDMGDLGAVGTPCQCGRPTATLERIEGRTVENIFTVDGSLLTPFFINPIMKDFSTARQYQFAQTGPMHYQLRLVGGRRDQFSSIENALKSKLGSSAQLDITTHDSIPALPSGKRPYVLNEWKRSQQL